MLKIEKSGGFVKLGSLECGETFEYEDRYYIKLSVNINKYNLYCFDDNENYYLYDNSMVRVVSCVLHIKE